MEENDFTHFTRKLISVSVISLYVNICSHFSFWSHVWVLNLFIVSFEYKNTNELKD